MDLPQPLPFYGGSVTGPANCKRPMTLHYNRSIEKAKRRFLRHHMTNAETLLWAHLRNRQLLGYKFRRQHSVGAYVIDFYCPEKELALELDGESHNTKKAREHDMERKEHLERFGIHSLRFKNEEVFDDIKKVLSSIVERVEETRGAIPSATPPRVSKSPP